MFKRFYSKIAEFFKDLRSELKKVTYPTKSETVGSTAVVLVFVFIVGIFLAMIDALLVKLVRQIIQ
jgi:preprotein translocase subunit SecE